MAVAADTRQAGIHDDGNAALFENDFDLRPCLDSAIAPDRRTERHDRRRTHVFEACRWRARTSFERGLEQTVAWYRENEGWWKALRTRDSVSSS